MRSIKDRLKEIHICRAIRRSGLFDPEHYLRNNLDVARSCMDPIKHYIRHGWRESRNPSKLFDTKWYIETYTDVAAAGINPLYHYLKHGRDERRSSSADFNTESHSSSDSVYMSTKRIGEARDGLLSASVPSAIEQTTGQASKDLCVQTCTNDECILGLVSIITPVYNTEQYLPRLLDSVMRQTYNHTEVVLVDDGSWQKTVIQSIADEYKDKLNLFLYRSASNCGANHARNYGFSKSCGEFVFFCDSDVVLSDKILERMLQRMHEAPAASWVYCNYLLGNRKFQFHPFDGNRLYGANFCSTMSLIRRSYFPGFDVAIKRYQDWDLFLTVYENGGTGEWIDEFLFYAEDRPDGITNSSKVTDSEARAILKRKHAKVDLL